MRVAVREDQLLCVYNLTARDVIFLRTCVLLTDRQLKDKQPTQLVHAAGDNDASLYFQFR